MEWNTKSFTNISNETFVGRYNGVDFYVKSGEMRFFPSEVSDHLGKQLMAEVAKKEAERKIKKTGGILIDQIVGKEIATKDDDRQLSFKERVESHERQFAALQEQIKRQELIKKEEALKIAKENV